MRSPSLPALSSFAELDPYAMGPTIDMAETAAVYGIAPTSVDTFARQFFGKR